MIKLDFVTSSKAINQESQATQKFYTGHQYVASSISTKYMNTPHGIVGDYKISPVQGKAQAVTMPYSDSIYLWDTDIDLKNAGFSIAEQANFEDTVMATGRIKSNYIEITRQALEGPQLITDNGATRLSLSMFVDFTFATANYAAQLAMVHLVEATRFINLENGRQVSLLDTQEQECPVLYLENPADEQALKLIGTPQPLATKQSYCYQLGIEQNIPEHYEGEKVETVTVLEQYRSFVMQRAVPFDEKANIWTPIYAPLLWGWSIRVGRRVDGEWGILKRKLILPTPGNDGLQLPEWDDNTINCSNHAK